ncbi:hypothetical protein BDP27DRAFT_396306 [Rhodocollybia butyracea]|uniref:Uncharacterized protein n=1 Tax=Rhodocollybia butyracea TaxID=206335 RepID=A0A9P5UA09_9AGAR|nr:hypothetical protein BDP27DRAFT_396306 [Rhodocollybia butyracea]
MDFSFDSVVTEASTRPLFDYSSAGAGSSNTRSRSNAAAIDVLSFKNDGFSDFTLDLSCLSNTSSPASDISTPLDSDHELNVLPTPSPSYPLLPVQEQSHSRSSSPIMESSSTQLSTINRATSMMRMSLPGMKYIGRGTPIDPGRRSQWGGRMSEDATEDGMLFPEERARSLDAHTYPSRRSLSSEWNTVPGPRTLSPLHMDIDSALENHVPNFLEPLPESSKIQIQVDSDPAEWESVMKTVLGSSGIASSSNNRPSDGETSSRRNSRGPIPGLPAHPNGFDIVLGLNSALDLGLGLGKGMNFFDLDLIPNSGRDTPSVYSLAPESPEPTRSPSVEKSNNQPALPEKEREQSSSEYKEHQHRQEQHLSEDDHSGSTTAEAPPPRVVPFEPKAMRDVHRVHWWRRAVSKLRKVQKLIKSPSMR